MASTRKFDEVVDQLHELIKNGGNFTLSAANAEKIAKGLKKVLLKLPGQEVILTGATEKKDKDAGKWTLTGYPSPLFPAWPAPGFVRTQFDLKGSKITLKVTDGGQDEEKKDKECKFELTLAANIPIVTASLPVSLVAGEKDELSLVLGESQKPMAVDPVRVAEEMDLGSFYGEIADAAKLINLRKATFFEGSIQTNFDPEPKKASVAGFSFQCSLTFGPATVGFTIKAKRNDSGEFEFSVTGSVAKAEGYYKLGAVFSELAGVKVWPSEFDPEFKSFSFSRVAIPKAKRVNAKDTQRVVFQSPAESKKPQLLITCSFDSDESRTFTARLGWPALELAALPLFGGHLTFGFEPLLAIVTSRTMTVEHLADLCRMDDFKGLETMGVPKKEAKDLGMGKGIHCTGIVKISKMVTSAFQFPIRASERDVPFDLEDLPEPRAATPVPIQRSVGPVGVEGISFKFENGWISMMIDASVQWSGLTIGAVGMRTAFALKAPEDASDRYEIGIEGGYVRYKSDSVAFSGGLLRDTTSEGATDWIGTGLLRAGDAFSLSAMFAFRDGKEKELFLFAYVSRQLGGPAWCYITGLAAGFGYNRTFKIPRADQVNDFPLIDTARKLSLGEADAVPAKMDSRELKKISNKLTEFLSKDATGDNFGTFGITFTSFACVNSTLLLTVVFGTRLEFVLLGTSEFDIPKKTPAAHAELQLVGVVKPDDGIIALDALLSPNSYVLAKDCRLTGGFSMRAWLKGEHEGDFVLSLGGYNPTYIIPKHYPVVPRLGFLWKHSPPLRISGFAYCALTQKNIQLGGGLDLVYEVGPLRAWLHVEAHFQISWSPVSYYVGLRVDVGISFRIDLLFCSTTLSVDISADLKIWGEPFSGVAVIRLCFVSFTVEFGKARENPPPKILWKDFVSAFVTPVPKPTPPKHQLGVNEDEPVIPSPLDFVPLNGISPAPGLTLHGGPVINWLADPQRFELNITTAIPAEVAHFNNDSEHPPGLAIHAQLLEGTPHIAPVLTVKVERVGALGKVDLASGSLFQMKWTARIGAVPAALWGGHKEPDDVSDTKETIPGITHISLVPTVPEQGQSLPINVEILLFRVISTKDIEWEPVKIPQHVYDWKDFNPFKTITEPAVVNARKNMLDALSKCGLVPEDAAEKIDVSNVREEQPCFMVDPVLCSLGTAETAA
ncbi:MAG: DUF6603 domain-containing protein [Terracidiphilus sp.]